MQWLPALIILNDYGGDWERYLDAIYAQFQSDFCDNTRHFSGRIVRLKRHPITDEKEATFWHFVSQGKVENERDIDLRRAERIAWPLAFMENINDPTMKVWSETRNNSINIHIWNVELSYLVVVADRGDYMLPWTAYPVEYENQKRKLNRRWEQYKEL
jgi:hypothetical protein